MKLENRLRLLCTKQVRDGLDVLDQFSVVVLSGNESAAKSNYEAMGYRVTKSNL
jgi:hypothetical protein